MAGRSGYMTPPTGPEPPSSFALENRVSRFCPNQVTAIPPFQRLVHAGAATGLPPTARAKGTISLSRPFCATGRGLPGPGVGDFPHSSRVTASRTAEAGANEELLVNGYFHGLTSPTRDSPIPKIDRRCSILRRSLVSAKWRH